MIPANDAGKKMIKKNGAALKISWGNSVSIKNLTIMSQKQVKHALKIGSLVIRFLREELTPAERLELETWLQEDGKNKALLRRIFNDKLGKQDLQLAGTLNPDQAFERLIANIRQGEQNNTAIRRFKPLYAMAVAAILIFMILSAGLWIHHSGKDNHLQPPQTALQKRDPQESAEIMLTLADGSTVNLEKQEQGVITTQGKSVITKKDSGLLSYTAANNTTTGATSIAVNKLTIPRGKQYQLILPDGSRVWLNAQTTLTFPGNFASHERVVELSGEAYFEVAQKASWPFRVKTKEQTVEVLGTGFNVSAYPDDRKTMTTLADGSVKVSDAATSCLLKPGQVAVRKTGSGNRFEIADADLEETLGWKNGLLVLKDARTEELMQTISRIYDVDIEIDPLVKDRRFGGSYPIRNGLPYLLRNLEQTKVVHFKTNGRRVIVMP